MRKVILSLILPLWFAAVAAGATGSYLLSPCNDPGQWTLVNGAEFPGAKGGIATNPDGNGLKIDYDFSNGGKYVAVVFRGKLPQVNGIFGFKLDAAQECNVNYRLGNASGRFFQGKSFLLKAGNDQTVKTGGNGPWSAQWGGENGSAPLPAKEVWLMINRQDNLPLKGSVILQEFSLETDAVLKTQFSGEGFDLKTDGLTLTGKWLAQPEGAQLLVAAINTTGQPVRLSLNFPMMDRDNIARVTIPTRKNFIWSYLPPFQDGNRNNLYRIDMTVELASGTTISRTITLKGSQAQEDGFGAAIPSDKIAASKFGTCAHFSYGNNGTFKAWKPYRELTDMIAESGLKWLRDGCSAKKIDGKFKVSEYDLEWMKYVRSKSIDIILCIRLYPDMTIEEYKDYVAAIVQETSPYVNVYELGNEPNNFGWKPKFGGTWNGYEGNGKVSDWVKEHVKYTNALADHIKKIRPDATVIGLGSCPPTNFHALNLGVSKSLDGVVEHPYPFSMPPEKIPFGWNMEKRDGIRVGDKDNSFVGLINSYVEHFKKTGQMRSIWVTEFGFTSFWFDGRNEKKLYAGFTEETQAIYLVRRFMLGLTLPIEVSCQYDFIDDYNSNAYMDEANFGLIRADHSPKPAYYAIQRLTSLFNGFQYAADLKVKVESEPLHRSCVRGELVKDWDQAAISAANGVMAFGFVNPARHDERMLAVWSALPVSREFNNRVCTIRIAGGRTFGGKPVAIDMITGRSYDVPVKVDGDDLLLENLTLKGSPVVIRVFKP